MKTTNKIQKTALVAVAAGLAIICFASNAQPAMKSLFENIETNHIAMVMGKTNNSLGATMLHSGNLSGANAFAAYLATETEEPLELEDWMIDETSFATITFIEAETETPMEIEDWMINESNFDVNSFSLEIETEEEMNLESWMLDENNFNENINSEKSDKAKVSNKIISTSKYVFSDVNNEGTLKIEDWMLNSNIWK
jgi:hypothetical protein